ncbi:MAG: hypothetical protein IKN49_05760 [Elusimicrobiaceae bacterium]|nr:hypothetical protein [Elusimicrobiaceae bacterium]
MTKHFWKTLCSKAAIAAVLPLLFVVVPQCVHAQSAEIRSAGVYYIDGLSDINSVYCNWGADNISNAGQAAYKSGIVDVAAHQTADPWDTSALIEYDQPYPAPNQPNNYPNHCLALCFDVYCTNKPNGATTYSISFPLQTIQFEIAKYNNSKDIGSSETNPAVRTIMESIIDNNILVGGATGPMPDTDLSKYMCAAYSCVGSAATFGATQSCPNPQYECIEKSALSSSDMGPNCQNPPSDIIKKVTHCCRSLNTTASTYDYPAITTRDAQDSFVPGKKETGGVEYIECGNSVLGCKDDGSGCINGRETPCIQRSMGTGKGYNDPIRFCTSWDGSYEILGEFGKTNGQFGFRANVKTNYPGDNIAVEEIAIDDTFIYPSDNQYPIQVDVTNVHTVRSTATVVGSITSVMATPYTVTYRLSKDADVSIQVFDASHAVPYTQSDWNPSATMVDAISYNDSTNILLTQPVRHLVDWQPRLGEGMKGSDKDVILQESESWDGRDDSGRLLPANNYLISIQAKTQDEWPGTDFSRAVTRQLSLDPLKLTDIVVQGLNKQSTAYARVNYVPTEASTVYFEVYTPGTTFASEYTRGFEPTGSRPVIANGTGSLVYSNHQQRNRGLSYPDKWDGLCHVATGCDLAYPRGKKLPFTGDVWNGTATLCTDPISAGGNAGTVSGQNCVITSQEGAPMPDGDYVYVLWAEVPYTDHYFNAAACYGPGTPQSAGCTGTINCSGNNGAYTCTTTVRGTTNTCSTAGTAGSNAAACTGAFTGVKTQRYYTGHLPIERGVVDITIQPVSYATIGSSPTAYGLDPFIFKYSIAREATVNAYVKNTAGVKVKTLTNEGGNTNVAQQMNTLTWDGRDDNGRMVSAGTYMFVVETSDPMFPQSVKTQAASIFPVDLYRVTNVSTTDVYGDSAAKATISYMLSKAMNVQINIYNKDVVVPVQNTTAGAQQITQETTTANVLGLPELPGLTSTAVPATVIGATLVAGDSVGSTYYVYTTPVVTGSTYYYYRALKYVSAVTATTENYEVQEVVRVDGTTAPWPPRVCDRQTDAAYFTGGYVDPTKFPQCIYVNDTNFTNYPANPKAAEYNYTEGARQTLDVRLQPVKTFNRSALKAGDGVVNMEEWDAQYFYNPTPVSVADGGKNTLAAVQACKNQTDITKCPYEMIPDGTYPLYIAARTQEPVDVYYNQTTAIPFRTAAEVLPQTGLYATDKPVYRINISRGPVYFIDGTVAVYPNAPQLYNVSSGPIFVPPYEINFSISRAATVEVAVVALQDGLCTTTRDTGSSYSRLPYNNKAGDVCKFLSTMTIPNTANFDPNIVRKLYWDGTDNNGKYVKNGNYEIRLTAKNYPDEGLYQPTVKQLTLNVDLLKVYDLPESEAYSINKRGIDMKVSYQISVPMKVAIQIFKPGTTIYDYTKGTLRDPSTGQEVTDIRDVLVRSIVGIRPSTTLIEEVWDGTDYAQQGVPDGTYPLRFVTALNGADIDSVTGEVLAGSDAAGSTDYKINYVADTYQYVNLHHATVAIGDGEFVCEDWEKTVFFYPNPFKTATGTLEITKLPVPGKMSIKMYNLAGDLVREGGYTCVDAQNMSVTMGSSLQVSPDNNVSSTTYTGGMPSLRNAALRCFWDKTNDHGKRVARGVYFGLVDFRAQNGRQHCQKVVKILIPR